MKKEDIIDKLKSVPDPELGISLVDLGLIYDASFNSGRITVLMTLTTVGCPLFSVIAESVKAKLLSLKAVKEVEVELTFDPPWNTDMMSEEAKVVMGLI